MNVNREACVPTQVLPRYPRTPCLPAGGARPEMAVSMLQAGRAALKTPYGNSSTGGRILSTSGQRLTAGAEKPRARSHCRAMTTSFTAYAVSERSGTATEGGRASSQPSNTGHGAIFCEPSRCCTRTQH